jgi:hypothetical protein
MVKFIRAGVDSALAILLAAVLVLIYWVDAGKTLTPPVPPVSIPPVPAPKLRLAVTPGTFDDMGRLLQGLGEGYRFETIEEATLCDLTVCRKYAAIFLTCTKVDGPEAATRPALAETLREFVAEGGTLYASDLQFDTLAAAFREAVDGRYVALGGKAERVVAAVVDADLRKVLGPEMPLHFDQDNWRPAAFGGLSAVEYLKGTVPIKGGATREVPLLVKFRYREGTVIFTSFHNEKVNSELESKLLRFLVLSAVTASVESRATRELGRGGFTLKEKSLLSATEGDPSVTRTFTHAKAGKLKFTLNFEDRGGVLKLEVVAPDGKQREVRRGGSTLTIDVPDAAPGDWQCIVTAENVPFPNFPFVLTVGEPIARSPSVPVPIPTPVAGGPVITFTEVPVAMVKQARSDRLRIGVTKPKWDDMGTLLGGLGEGYQYKEISNDDLLNPPALDGIDILFLTCSPYPADWGPKGGMKGVREGTVVGELDPEKLERNGATLRRFVERGGTLYASDYRAEMVYNAFRHRHPGNNVNPATLHTLEIEEREYLRLFAPGTKSGTVAETLRQADLSDDFKNEAHFNVLLAAVEQSSLVDGNLTGPRGNVIQIVRKELEKFFEPVAQKDVEAIAQSLERWDAGIQAAHRAQRQSEKTAAVIPLGRVTRRLKELRGALFELTRGRGPQTVRTTIVDRGLRDALGEGDTVPVRFDRDGWFPARFRGSDVTVLMEGEFVERLGGRIKTPLLVRFPEKEGTVIFTSFHNETVNSELETKLLKFLVFTAVTAKEEAVAYQELVRGGFSQSKRDLNSHKSGDESVPSLYRTTKSGPLRFALSFTGERARLKFTIIAPNGRDKFEKVVTTSVIVETSDAPAGEWVYTVTALEVPFENFPWSVSVGEVGPTPKAP